jgi:hypothetical protein
MSYEHSMASEFPVKQAIAKIIVPDAGCGNPAEYIVGKNCTLIDAVLKSGEYCFLPYLRVWVGKTCIGEFNQHKITGLWFAVGTGAA